MNRLAFWAAYLLVLLSCRSQLKVPEPPACAPPLASCPDTSGCIDLLNDPARCGACQSRCPAQARCVQGACVPLCPQGFVDCAPDAGAPACTDVQRDPRHCGGCGKACSPWEVCRAGRCDLTCGEGQSLCPGGELRFCTDVRSDNLNCGACGHVCAPGKACRQGSCDDCSMSVTFSERDWVRPVAPLRSTYLVVTPRVSGDFNGDGKLDLAVDLGFGQIRVFWGDGTGQLAPGPLTTLKLPNGASALVAVDINRDGRLDLVALVKDSSSKLMALLGKGDGRFDPQPPLALPSVMGFITASDVNRDGTPDLVIAENRTGSSSSSGIVLVVLVGADGSMRIFDQWAANKAMQPLLILDMTGDDIPDLVLAQTSRIVIMRGLGDGKFEQDRVLFETWQNMRAVAGDLDHDDKPELIVMGLARGDAGETVPKLGIMDGATGKIRETLTEVPSGDADLYVDDGNRDGKLDVIVGNSINSSKDVWVLAGKGDGTLVAGPRQELGATDLSAGDFNGDGSLDLVVGAPLLNVCLGLGNGRFAPPANRLPTSNGTLEAGDVDGDRSPDMIISSRESLSVLRGKGNGSFHQVVTSPYRFDEVRPAVADFDGDRRVEICCSADLGLMRGQSDGSLLSALALPRLGCRGLNRLPWDWDGDGLLDLISAEEASICIMRGLTRSSFGQYKSHQAWIKPSAATLGDVDGDHRADVVAVVSGASAVAILYGKADGSLEKPVQYAVGPAPTAVTLSDWNGDGRPDLVVADEGGLSTFQNMGERAWGPRFTMSSPLFVKRVLNVDWNDDGKGDLLAIAPSHGVTAIVSRGDGRFEASALGNSLGAYDAAIADFNQDGRPDIAITETDRTLARVFLHNGVACAH